MYDFEFNFDKDFIDTEKDTDNSGLEELDDKTYKKFVDKTYLVIEYLEQIKLPKNNEQIRLITFRPFNAIHFLKYISNKEKIKHVAVACYSINAEAAKMLNHLIELRKI